ncbi:helix-turn-helix domain-containing protein [Pisciglobus halotolerans]|uniref:Mga helix-turn-helix domain-containing protein n=1 Tax=Pisciglobus halotolerans TaxID=745365 RepID=A0A1I3BU36_9LACT|nr:helix-turn-helix domain-containing protein [Pisciglobus halotolerans]SFH65596.1 Mga helix-turn-helix domain-containing protein [Pisciglobus halotolerans]
MEIEDLLDKSERYQIYIIRQLVLNGGRIAYRELFASLHIAKASFDKYLENVKDRAQKVPHLFEFDWTSQELTLHLSEKSMLQDIIHLYVKESLKFQILDYLYQHQDFSVPQLTSKMALSEASFYRRLKEINGFLKEFDIQVRNGKMHGEELQIRYFFFQLYWFLVPYTQHQKELSESPQQPAIRILERNLAFNLPQHDRCRLNLWLTISRKRILLKYKTYWQMRRKMEPFLEHTLYIELKDLTFRFLSRYSIEAEEEEAMMLFIFLNSMSILPETAKNTLWTDENDFISPVTTLDQQALLQIKQSFQLQTETEAWLPKSKYYLTQTHASLYFLTGDLLIFDLENIRKKEKRFTRPDVQRFAHQLLEMTLNALQQPLDEMNTLQTTALIRYTSILALIEQLNQTTIEVGIDLQMEKLYAEAFTAVLIQSLNEHHGIRIEHYQPAHLYDLVITNTLVKDRYSAEQRIYLLSELASQYDLQQIRKEMHHILQQKKASFPAMPLEEKI